MYEANIENEAGKRIAKHVMNRIKVEKFKWMNFVTKFVTLEPNNVIICTNRYAFDVHIKCMH